jgi:starch synthase
MIGELPAPEEVVWIDRYVHDSAEIAGYLRAANIYCLPSRHEGFAVAALEAMACGLPVVAADVPGVSDVFRTGRSSAGIVVKPENPEELAGALGELIDSPERVRALGSAGRRRGRGRIQRALCGAAIVGLHVFPRGA